MIPARIIQTGPPRIPLLLQAAVANVRLLHPAFEHEFFSDERIEDFIRDAFPDCLRHYNTFRFRIQKYDFFRYLAVYHFGGFYLDQDVFLARSLEPLLFSDCVFAFEELAECPYFPRELDMDWQLANYAFAAEAGHPFLARIIDNCIRAKRDDEWVRPMLAGVPKFVEPDYYVLNTTGPGLVSRTFAESPELAASITVLMPEDACDMERWHQFGEFGVHHMNGSWRRQRSAVERIRIRLWERRNLARMLAEGRKRGRRRLAVPEGVNSHEQPPGATSIPLLDEE